MSKPLPLDQQIAALQEKINAARISHRNRFTSRKLFAAVFDKRDLDKIFQRVDRSSSGGCWLWTGGTCGSGFGAVAVNGRIERVHRIVYSLLVGPIPPHESIRHRCHVPNCVRPEHLYLADSGYTKTRMQAGILETIKQNKQLRYATGSANGRARLTPEAVAEIRRCHEAGESYASLGRRFKVVDNTIKAVATGLTWNDSS
jgi:hypothetical protein